MGHRPCCCLSGSFLAQMITSRDSYRHAETFVFQTSFDLCTCKTESAKIINVWLACFIARSDAKCTFHIAEYVLNVLELVWRAEITCEHVLRLSMLHIDCNTSQVFISVSWQSENQSEIQTVQISPLLPKQILENAAFMSNFLFQLCQHCLRHSS